MTTRDDKQQLGHDDGPEDGHEAGREAGRGPEPSAAASADTSGAKLRTATATADPAKAPAKASGKTTGKITGAPRRPAEERITPFVRVPLFANLDAESLRELATVTRRRSYRPGEIIFHRDDPGQVLFVIREGKVRVYISSPDGQEVTLAVFGPGDYFGDLALLDGHPRSASAITLEPVEVYALQRSDFINAVLRHPRIGIEVMTVLSRRLRQTDSMVEDLLFLDVHSRVAKKLLELGEQYGVQTPDGILIDMRLTQADLATLVGASRESVNKVIGYFLDKRLVSTEKRKVTILRHADLRRHIG
jgi:CRP/FNR family cyclic AMP-dependent transcriptional regulator